MPAKAVVKEEWITIGVAARRLRVSQGTVGILIRRGQLSCRRVNSWRRVPASEVAALDRSATTHAVS